MSYVSPDFFTDVWDVIKHDGAASLAYIQSLKKLVMHESPAIRAAATAKLSEITVAPTGVTLSTGEKMSALKISAIATTPAGEQFPVDSIDVSLTGFVGAFAAYEIGTSKTAQATLSATTVANSDGTTTLTESVALTDNLPFLPPSYNAVLGVQTLKAGLETEIGTAIASRITGSAVELTFAVS